MAAEPITVQENTEATKEQERTLVDRLANQFQRASRSAPGIPLTSYLKEYETWLDQAYAFFRESSQHELSLTYASEWILDNYYVVREAVEQIHEDLPAGYYQRMPKLLDGPAAGFPRIYAIVYAILQSSNNLLNLNDLQNTLNELQDHFALTIGEVWAVPIFLRFCVVEALSTALEKIIRPPDRPYVPHIAEQALEGYQPASGPPEPSTVVANSIISLRAVADLDWRDFFDSVNQVEQMLREDPAKVYAAMDFPTRDLYRKQVEHLAFNAEMEEITVTQHVLELARQAVQQNGHLTPAAERFAHVGYYLIDDGLPLLEKQIGYAPSSGAAVGRWITRHPTLTYLGGIFAITAVLLALLSLAVLPAVSQPILTVGLIVLSAIPAITIATHLINWLVTQFARPRILPKLLFRSEIPDQHHTLVAIPALIGSTREIDALMRQLLLHSLRNPESGLSFGLLTDFNDAKSEHKDEDDDLLEYARKEIELLNQRYPAPGEKKRFYLFHRRRVQNPSEGKWIGWERKRGKLHELNQLLLHTTPEEAERLTFIWPGGVVDAPKGVRYVITLDADTELPSAAARRMVGTMAHPLNRAIFDPASKLVSSGYTILQPRVEISPTSARHTWFTRIFAGDTGLDLYSRAVSDAYMDLFGEGIYVGKGIYDVAAFDRSVHGHIPENTVLSHDLLEGLMGRAGLVSDITLVEDYPPDYRVQTMRQQRWIRGDWQLLPWLLAPGRFGLRFGVMDLWKLIDNLRRSLLAPVLLTIFVLGLLFLPQHSAAWTGVVLLSLGFPAITTLIQGVIQLISSRTLSASAALSPTWLAVLRSLIAVAFVPYEMLQNLDSIFTTLYRLIFTRRNLLQWTTAAHTVQLLRTRSHLVATWQRFLICVVIGLGLSIWLSIRYPPYFLAALPILLLWITAPMIYEFMDSPVHIRTREPLSEEDIALLRHVARRTWGFFERFVGPEDHWLPPDHFQESPVGVVAHRTSPTNIGLLLNSTLAAYDLGYLDPLVVTTRLTATFDTLRELERFRGHFLNWYDTLSLRPLNPRYVSTVDSGNLAASLIVVAQACRMLPEVPIFRWELWQGYLDSLAMLRDTLLSLYHSQHTRPTGTVLLQTEIEEKVDNISQRICAVKENPRGWYELFIEISGPFWKGLTEDLGKLVSAGSVIFDLNGLRALQQVAAQMERQHLAVQRVITELVPWIPILENPPALSQRPELEELFAALRESLSYRPSLVQLRETTAIAQPHLDALREGIHQLDPTAAGSPERIEAALRWVENVELAIISGQTAAGVLINGFYFLAEEADRYVREMDFTFLYHPQRRIFHLGYNLESSQLDDNFYDLLASEARIASLVAIGKGDVPIPHWIQLSRPVTSVDGRRVLLSWSATMFEYLMPPLFFRTHPGTLLAESAAGAVTRQIAYGQSKGVPWGISESGFYRFDASQSYQYRAFGVPGLGFKRGLGDDLVIAPYASLMALSYDAPAVVQNIHDLIELNMLGLYGFYEAADFTTDRLLVGEKMARVQEYMSHHQGMILLAMDNFFASDITIKRMYRDPRIQSIDLLLQEQVPMDAPLRTPHSEDVKGIQRLTPTAPVEVNPWSVPVQTHIPQVHLLSNGNYSVILTNSGSGYSTWKGTDLTRWQPDVTLDPWGSWIYIEDRTSSPADGPSDALWSAAFQPVPCDSEKMQVTFFAHMAVYRRSEGDIIATTEVTISPDDPLEIRRVHLFNSSSTPRTLRLTSYGEVILTQQSSDARHPAFNKLFIESEYVPELNLQIFKRRPRSNRDEPIYLGHMLVLSVKASPDLAHTADRYTFLGRHGSARQPGALAGGPYLSGASGATLDPIFALGQQVQLGAHANAVLAYMTFAADSREEILALAGRYQNWTLIERAFQQSDISQQSWLTQQNMDTQAVQNTLQALSAMLYPHPATRAPAEILAGNRLGQAALWRFGISGDFPILLVEVKDPRHIELVRQALQVHRYLRHRSFMIDVVIVNHQQIDYGAQLNGMLYRLVSRVNSEQWLNQRGGIYILYSTQMQPEEYTIIQTAARVMVSGDRGLLGEQLPGYAIHVPHLPEFRPTVLEMPVPQTGNQEIFSPADVQYFNGFGGFTQDGKEYVIRLEPGHPTPAPWINVIGYPHFGFFVTEAGSQCTWSLNSGENRLTPWFNDPVRDPSGETLYLRDEETGVVWSPTPQPVDTKSAFTVRHGAGYTIFDSTTQGIRHRMRVYASPRDPVKIIHLHLENLSGISRQITATQYIEWVLGTTRAINQPYIIPEFDPEHACLLATNPYSHEFSGRYAFLAASRPIRGLTADRVEFLGRAGTPAFPAALSRLGLEARITPGEDPCAVIQVQLDLDPDGTAEVFFLLGEGSTREEAAALVDQYREPAAAEAAWEETQVFWENLLGRIQVKTPQPAADLILNRWMLYQALSCRLWGRSAFYQSSGAFGFRDQLQDVLALRFVAPELMRDHILNAARHQFTEGDVLHWWHPPSGRGVRTLFSDDLLWLPYVTALYVEATGDQSILEEPVPFRYGPLLLPGEEERYGEFPLTEGAYPLIEHCRRAIEKGSTSGAHELPLMGTGDWNDGMNQVGAKGQGESVWLAWFLIDVLNRFADVIEGRSQNGFGEWARLAGTYRERAKHYGQVVEKHAWDGAWYRRAYYDDGSPLGSAESEECQIDAIAQSWSVISRAGEPQHARQAVQSVMERLVRPEDRLLLLFTPPFDKTSKNPGYIKGYLPGIRENGGQYTHAAIWTNWSVGLLGMGDEAGRLYDFLNPIFHAEGEERAVQYRVEPYVICADIYSVEPYNRRGGWTWYTGSASWMYRLGIETLLGFAVTGSETGQFLRVDPVIPTAWDGFEITYRYGSSPYHIQVSNPRHVSRGVQKITLDGKEVSEIALTSDGREHQVQVVLG